MGKYKHLLSRARKSAYYWAQYSMRNFVGDALKRMDARNMTRVELAQALDVSPAYVTKILRGDVNFTLDTMSKIAHAVGGRINIEIVDAYVSGASVHQSRFSPMTRVANFAKGEAKRIELAPCANEGRFETCGSAPELMEEAA
jgi:transcriptional regulator with XRE-family HTH domain